MTDSIPADTIAAISTPMGEAGIGIVRLSGPRPSPWPAAFFGPGSRVPAGNPTGFIWAISSTPEGATVDEVLLTLMRAPHTYTREDVVEINCHSGYGVLRRILELALAQGVRLARPGEFTLRAFLAGRLDLTQAEAVLEVIRARTATSLKVAADHLEGALGRGLRQVRQNLLDLLARVEAALDFPEEAAETPPGALAAGLEGQMQTLARLAATYQEGRLLREGLLVVIAGRPNVGKSSLLNCLLNLDRAIVTEIPGTTRDMIEESITLGGVAVRLSDTAGLRPARDRLEALGIERTRERLSQADLILYLLDGSNPLAPGDRTALADLAGRRGLAVINKTDLPAGSAAPELAAATQFPIVKTSALTGQGIDALKQEILNLALGGGLKVVSEVVTQARHHQHLVSCLDYLRRGGPPGGGAPLGAGGPGIEAIRELGEITGEEVGDAVLDRIFAQFCLGK